MNEQLKKLQKLFDASLKTLEGLEQKMVQAEEDQNPDNLEAAKKEFDAANVIHKDLTTKLEAALEAAEAKVKQLELVGRTKKALELVFPGDTKGLGFAQAKDHLAEERTKVDMFNDYCFKGIKWLDNLEGNRRDLIVPKSQSFTDGASGVVMPTSMVRKVLGAQITSMWSDDWKTKAIPAVSSDNTQGGYTVFPDYHKELLETPMPQPSLFQMATVIPVISGKAYWPQCTQTDSNEFGAVSVDWIGEAESKPETEMAFTQLEIDTFELAAYTEISHRLLSRSAIAMEPLLNRLFRAAILYELDRTIIKGLGVNQPIGILRTTDIREVTRVTALSGCYEDLVNLEDAVLPYHRAGARYIMNHKFMTKLKLEKDKNDRPLMTDTALNATTGNYGTLNGYPYTISAQLPTLGDDGDCLFGAPVQYLVGMEQEVVVRKSDEIKMRNNCAAFSVFLVAGGRLPAGRLFSKLKGATS